MQNRAPKVHDLDGVRVGLHHQVGWLEVPVDDLVIMQVVEAL